MGRAAPFLPADDLGVAKQFYVGGLGFRVAFETTEDGKNGRCAWRGRCPAPTWPRYAA